MTARSWSGKLLISSRRPSSTSIGENTSEGIKPASSFGLMSLKVWAMPLSSLIQASSSASPRLWVAQGNRRIREEVAERDLPGDRRQVVRRL